MRRKATNVEVERISVDVPDGRSGDWTVETFEVRETDREFILHNLRCDLSGMPWLAMRPGTYKRLKNGRTIIMSNTPMEIITHRPLFENATGDVLINGLGLGMALKKVLSIASVRSVTVVEKSPDVISLVAPTFAKDRRVTIIEADAFLWKPSRGVRYDAAWHDVWPRISKAFLPEMKTLRKRYARKSRWQGCWSEDQIRKGIV